MATSASKIRESAQDNASSMMDTVKESVKDARDTAMQYASDGYQTVRDSASEYFEQGKRRARELSGDMQNRVRENPMTAILGAAAVGFVIGLLWVRR